MTQKEADTLVAMNLNYFWDVKHKTSSERQLYLLRQFVFFLSLNSIEIVKQK